MKLNCNDETNTWNFFNGDGSNAKTSIYKVQLAHCAALTFVC